jgi:outer membrane protein OmpA-like peptidoglycan-associated protein
LPAQSKLVVDEFAIFLQENPSMKVAIQGHTDDVGNDANNMVLSDNRAKAVYDYLVSKGIDSSRLSSKGFGETKPLVPNTSEPNRAKNRRTEFVIVAK